MEFVDVHIRAWKTDDTHAQVLVHNSPAGDMRKPVTVDYPAQQIEQLRGIFLEGGWFMDARSRERLAELGRSLWNVLLPRPVHALLQSSLDRVGQTDGLRVRLCMDQHLIDLPWEYLYNPEAGDERMQDEFLFLDGRLSLVREPPIGRQQHSSTTGVTRMVFAGAYRSDGVDLFEVRTEADGLSSALAPVRDRLSVEVISADGDHIQDALRAPAAIFHYAGHADVAHGRGFIVRELGLAGQQELAHVEQTEPEHVAVWGDSLIYDPLDAELVAGMLRRAGTRLAVFNACNSGRWFVAEPINRAGVTAMIGLQGNVSNRACIKFGEKLYASLINGLSLDEAVTWARISVLQDAGFDRQPSLEWGNFMVYLPTSEVVLFPQAAGQEADRRRAATERERAESISASNIGSTLSRSAVGDKRTLRKAIVQRLTLDNLRVLCADIEEDLAQDGVDLPVNLGIVGGSDLESNVLGLIDYLDRRGRLPYLVAAVRRDWPGIY